MRPVPNVECCRRLVVRWLIRRPAGVRCVRTAEQRRYARQRKTLRACRCKLTVVSTHRCLCVDKSTVSRSSLCASLSPSNSSSVHGDFFLRICGIYRTSCQHSRSTRSRTEMDFNFARFLFILFGWLGGSVVRALARDRKVASSTPAQSPIK